MNHAALLYDRIGDKSGFGELRWGDLFRCSRWKKFAVALRASQRRLRLPRHREVQRVAAILTLGKRETPLRYEKCLAI